MTTTRWRALVGAVFALAFLVAGCGSDREAGGRDFEPSTPGVLTVATANVPAPGFWEGAPDAPTGGFEQALAAKLADEFGLDTVKVEVVPFGDIAAGRLGTADLALTQMTRTDERDENADFSTPYLTAAPGVLVRRGVEARDHEELKELRWTALDVSTLTPVVEDQVRPDDPILMVGSRTEELDALRSGRADAVLLDLPVAQGIALAEPQTFEVIGQLNAGEGLSAVLPEGSPNVEIVDSSIRKLESDGTIDELVDRWLGGDLGDVPLIRVDD